MSTGTDLSNVSTLDDVIVAVQALFAAVADPTTFAIGESHDRQEGAPPRIFVVVGEDGDLGDGLVIGDVAGITESATFYVWGAGATSDNDRLRSAKALCVRLINALQASAPGRLESAKLTHMTGTKLAKFGEQYQLEISYTWAVPRDEEIFRAVPTLYTPKDSPPDRDRPNGATATTYEVLPTLTNERDE